MCVCVCVCVCVCMHTRMYIIMCVCIHRYIHNTCIYIYINTYYFKCCYITWVVLSDYISTLTLNISRCFYTWSWKLFDLYIVPQYPRRQHIALQHKD